MGVATVSTALVVLAVLVAVNPAAAGAAVDRVPPRRHRSPAVVVSFGAHLCAAAVAGPVRDALEVTVGTFRLGAAAVVGVTALRMLVSPPPPVRLTGRFTDVLVPLGLGTCATPASLVVTVAASAPDASGVAAVVAAVLAGGVAAAVAGRNHPAAAVGARLTAAVGVVAAVATGVAGVRTL